jgi:hypothetical protein
MVKVIKLRIREMYSFGAGLYVLRSPDFDSWCVATIIKDECLVGYAIGSGDWSIRGKPEVFRISLARANYREIFHRTLLKTIHRRVMDQANHHAFHMQVAQTAEDTEDHSENLNYYMETERVIRDLLKELDVEERRATRNNS